MKPYPKIFLHLFLIVGLAIIACAMTPDKPLPTLTPTLAPAATVAATPSATASTELTPGINIAHWIKDQTKAGKFTREQGLVAALQIAAGENPAISLPATGNKFEGGTDVIRLARDYVKVGQDPKTKTEMQRLLNIIFPSNAILEKYSVKATAAIPENPFKLASLMPEVNYQDDCLMFWRNGFPTGAAPGGTCFEYRGGDVGGSRYRIFYPASWRGNRAPEVVRAMDRLPQTEQALRDTLTAYTRLGTFRNVNVIFSGLIYSDAGVNAGAYTNVPTETEPCPLVLYAPIFQLPEAYFKQTIAHELFHCFQHWNFPQQTDVIGTEAENWWVEGTAEYFSNVVYPDTNYEYRFINDFDTRSSRESILQMEYENFLFFQFLAHTIQHRGIFDLIRTLPTSGGEAEQLTALSRYPQMNVYFQSFALSYIDRNIRDTTASGALIPVNPVLGTPLEITAAATPTLVGASSFVIGRKVIRFAPNKGFAMQVRPSDDRGRSTARTVESHSWGALPVSIGCGDANRNYIVVATTTTPNDIHLVNANITVTQDNCLPTPTPAPGCMVGRWAISAIDYAQVSRAAMLSQMPAGGTNEVTLMGATGNASYLLNADGTGQFSPNQLAQTYRFNFGTAGRGAIQDGIVKVMLNGVIPFQYTVTPTSLMVNNATGSLTAQIEMNIGGAITNLPPQPISIPINGAYNYQCVGSNELRLTFPLPDGGQSNPLPLTKTP